MKKMLCFICCTVLFIACTKGDDTTPAPEIKEIDKLPPATQTGANKVGCLVNGKAFLPRGSNPVGGNPNPYCGYYQDAFSLSIYNIENSTSSINIYIHITETILEQNVKYSLEGNSLNKIGYYYINNINNEVIYKTSELNRGEFYITKLDKTNNIISGTFWFDAVNDQGKKVEIREGRFDMTFEGWAG